MIKKEKELSRVCKKADLNSRLHKNDKLNVVILPQNENSVNNKKQYQDRNLVAVHNLTADELEKSLNLGGLAMPSIAVVKDDFAHTEYGDVSVLFSRDTIDPEVNRENKDKRVIDFDKKKRNELSVIAENVNLGNITSSFLNNNLSQFIKKSIKKEPAAIKSPGFANDSLPVTSSTISISDSLDYVNKILPEKTPHTSRKRRVWGNIILLSLYI